MDNMKYFVRREFCGGLFGALCFSILIFGGVVFTSTTLAASASVNTTADSTKYKMVTRQQLVKPTQKIQPVSKPGKSSGKAGRILVKFKNSISANAISTLNNRFNAKTLYTSKSVDRLRVIQLPDNQNIDEAIKAYRSDPAIEYAEPDQPIKLKVMPDDPDFGELWGLNNTGQSGGSNDADINAPSAWDITQGDSSVVVAVVDSGVDYTHVDLVDNIWVNPNEIAGNGIDDDGNGIIDDIHGYDSADNDSDPMDIIEHGTHVAGTIGARGNNNLRVAGVNWDVKIIACKIFGFSQEGPDLLEAVISDAIECLDYLYDLKVNRNINIVATNNSWGWIGNESRALFEAIQRQHEAGILFVAAAGNDSISTDQVRDYPSTYYLPNIISVAASNRNDQLAFFTNTGKRSVHVTAPGVDILSTVPGILPDENPHNDIFFDNVESGRSTWSTSGTWNITNSESYGGNSSWADSPGGNYNNEENSSLTSRVIDLTPWAGESIYLGFYANYLIEPGFDNVYVEISANNGLSWGVLTEITGLSTGWEFVSLEIPALYHTDIFRLRFRMESDDSVVFDGIYLDDIGIGTGALTETGSTSVALLDGTSMAAPHVTGLLALLKAQDSARDWIDLKNLVISAGTPKSSFSDHSVSGRRLRAADSDDTGSLTCNNQTVLGRLQPLADYLFITEGDPVNLSMLNINCEQAAGPVSVTFAESPSDVELLDNGTGYDQTSGDGIYSAQVDIQSLGLREATFSFPDSSSLNVSVVENYPAVNRVAKDWCEISNSGQMLPVGDDTIHVITSPFPINFGNVENGFRRLAISSNGTINLQYLSDSAELFPLYENLPLPTTVFQNVVAPYWDDLIPYQSQVGTTVGNVRWGILGTAPNRKLIVQWSNMLHVASQNEDGVTFQAVFFENATGVLFNYRDLNFRVNSLNNGGSATVGLQVAPGAAQQFSFNSASLSKTFSLYWGLDNEPLPKACLPTKDDILITHSSDGAGLGFIWLALLTFILCLRVYVSRKV